MFTQAIVRRPCKNMLKGISQANLGLPDYEKACQQHTEYIDALKRCGLKVNILNADDQHPDSCFVEDTALLTPHCAIVARPGSTSRRSETPEMRVQLEYVFENVEQISSPGTLDAGDIMMVGDHYYIGLSERTNLAGARQMKTILSKYKLSASLIQVDALLHLKSGVSYLENNYLVIGNALKPEPCFKAFTHIHVPESEQYAANCLWINDVVLIPEGFPRLEQNVSNAGFQTLSLNMSEFRKLDGGLSCLSLRF